MTAAWREELWDQFAAICDREKDGQEFLKELEGFLRGRASLEKEFAKKLASLTKTKSSDMGTVNSAWIVLKRETDALAKAHSDFADRLSADCDNILKNYINDTKKVRSDIVKNGQKLLSDLDTNRKANDKNKQAYAQSCKKKDEFQRQYDGIPSSTDPSAVKVMKKLVAESKGAEKLDDSYKKSVIKVQEVELRLYETEMPGWIQRMQELEAERVDVVRRAMVAYVDCEESYHPALKQSAEAVSLSVGDISADADILEFQNLKRTGASIPAKTEYEPYDPALGTCRPSSTSSSSSASRPAASSGSFSASTARPAVTSSVASSVATGAGVAAGAGAGAGAMARPARSDVGGSKPPKAAAARPSSAASEGGGGGDLVVAKYNYVAQESTELGFAQGDVIRVISRDDSGWWVGELNGRQGDFPSNHVEEHHGASPAASSPSASAAPAASGVNYDDFDQCSAQYDYHAEDEGELNITAGDHLTVEEEDDQGWYYGHNVRTGAYGRYPSNYVKFDSS